MDRNSYTDPGLGCMAPDPSDSSRLYQEEMKAMAWAYIADPAANVIWIYNIKIFTNYIIHFAKPS